MKALVRTRYGGPEVVHLADVPKPEAGPGEVLVKVMATGVSTGDWRIRAGAFPGILAVPGRLAFGVTKPRSPMLGMEFAGVVDAVGEGVTAFAVGDRVFGTKTSGGASAEYLAIKADAAICKIPEALSFEEAAALPFGGLCALVFLEQFATLKAGQSLLVIGASGGVGVYMVQIGKSLGAEVSAVAGPDSQALLSDLRADHPIDYTQQRVTELDARFDVIIDSIGLLSSSEAHALLTPTGQFFPLTFGLGDIGAALLNPFRQKKTRIAVNDDKAEDLARLCQKVESSQLSPVIDQVYPWAEAQAAHARVEGRHRKGATVLRIETAP